MIISKAKLREMIDRELEEERKRQYVENRLTDLGRDLYGEVGRLETMIRDIERRVMAHVEENKHENA